MSFHVLQLMRVALLCLSSCCLVIVIVFLTLLCVGLQCVIVAFPDHTYLVFNQKVCDTLHYLLDDIFIRFCSQFYIQVGEGPTPWLLFVNFTCVFCQLPMWYPWSGVVLECVDSVSLQPFLLCLSELFCLCCVVALKVSPHFHFVLLLFQYLGLHLQSPSMIPFPGNPLHHVTHLRSLDDRFPYPVV